MNPEVMPYEALAKELMRRCMADEEPEDMRKWLLEKLAGIGAGGEDAVMPWEMSFDYTDAMLDHFAEMAHTPESERRVLLWPWASWNNLIDPLEPGMLAVITAPDGLGKTIYAESIAEFWAQHKHHVVFVHYELNRRLMMLRRLARHTSISSRDLKSGNLSIEKRTVIANVRPRLMAWDGCISYAHTPGWSMERTTAELRRLHSEGLCDVVVVDYLEKAAASKHQLDMYGANAFQREADNVEQLKTFAEATEIPVLMVAQMNKSGKGQDFKSIDRSNMRGAGEKSEKANLVILLHRERVDEGYSSTVDVLVDKNTMGATGTFSQFMQPEYYRVGDIVR